MPVLSPENVKAPLVCLVGDRVLNFGAKHHLVATHEIKHHVLHDRLQGIFVDEIKEDFRICSNLNTDVSFDVVNETSAIDHLVHLPLPLFCVFIHLDFEKQDVRRASRDEGLLVY